MRTNPRKIFGVSIFLFIFALLAFYSFGRAENLILGPRLTITSPQNGQAFDSDLLTLKGSVKNASHLYLNDRQIFTCEEGLFEENLLLHYGYNIIENTALDRFGKEKTNVLKIVYQ